MEMWRKKSEILVIKRGGGGRPGRERSRQARGKGGGGGEREREREREREEREREREREGVGTKQLFYCTCALIPSWLFSAVLRLLGVVETSYTENFLFQV